MIYLIRHGETPQNAARVFQFPEAPLSETGRDQARRLAERLRGAGLRRVLASDYQRALETGRAIGAATGCEVETDALLRERHFGALRGKPYAEVGGNPFAPDYVPPGGESVREFEARAERAWASILAALAECGGPLAIVTHGLMCRAIVLGRTEIAPAARDGLAFRNTSLTIIEARAPYRVTLLACTAHLDATASSGRR
jgi:probable phosphoglycerate mutase